MYELVRYILPTPSRLETERRRDAARATRGGRRSPSSGDGAGDIGDRRGGQRVGLAVDDLAQGAEQVVARLGEIAGDDQARGVEDVDHRGQHEADRLPGLADHGDRFGHAGARQHGDVGGALALDPRLAQALGHRAPAGHGLHAAALAAAAHDVVELWDADVADVARAALRAALDEAVEDRPEADARARLDDHDRLAGPGLAERDHVDVVVDQHGGAEALGERVRDGEVVPAGHQERAQLAAGVEVHGARERDADRAHLLLGAAALGEDRFQIVGGGVEERLRVGADRAWQGA